MKRLSVVTVLLVSLGTTIGALTVPAEVVGVKVWVMEYQLNKVQSAPMATATSGC